MKKKIYSIYDVKADFFQPPVCFVDDDDCKRNLLAIFRNPETPLCQHADDFRVFDLGVFDDNSGELIVEFPPKFVTELAAINPYWEKAKGGE